MKKDVLKLGIPLSREEAGKIVGGAGGEMCVTNADCPMGSSCVNGVCGDDGIENPCPIDSENCPRTRPCSMIIDGKLRHGGCGLEVIVYPGTTHLVCNCIENQ